MCHGRFRRPKKNKEGTFNQRNTVFFPYIEEVMPNTIIVLALVFFLLLKKNIS